MKHKIIAQGMDYTFMYNLLTNLWDYYEGNLDMQEEINQTHKKTNTYSEYFMSLSKIIDSDVLFYCNNKAHEHKIVKTTMWMPAYQNPNEYIITNHSQSLTNFNSPKKIQKDSRIRITPQQYKTLTTIIPIIVPSNKRINKKIK